MNAKLNILSKHKENRPFCAMQSCASRVAVMLLVMLLTATTAWAQSFTVTMETLTYEMDGTTVDTSGEGGTAVIRIEWPLGNYSTYTSCSWTEIGEKNPTAVATPARGYKFKEWQDSNGEPAAVLNSPDSSESSIKKPSADVTLTAVFQKLQQLDLPEDLDYFKDDDGNVRLGEEGIYKISGHVTITGNLIIGNHAIIDFDGNDGVMSSSLTVNGEVSIGGSNLLEFFSSRVLVYSDFSAIPKQVATILDNPEYNSQGKIDALSGKTFAGFNGLLVSTTEDAINLSTIDADDNWTKTKTSADFCIGTASPYTFYYLYNGYDRVGLQYMNSLAEGSSLVYSVTNTTTGDAVPLDPNNDPNADGRKATFTMPADDDVNVNVTTFPEKAYVTGLDYIGFEGKAYNTGTEMKVYVLDGSETVLGLSGETVWYVSNTPKSSAKPNGITFTNNVTLAGDVCIILADGSAMTVQGSISGAGKSLYLYGQEGSTGSLDFESIACNDVTITGGIISSENTNGNVIVCSNNISITGGQVTIPSSNSGYGSLVASSGRIYLGWTLPTDCYNIGIYDASLIALQENKRFVAYDAATGTAATAVLSNSVSKDSEERYSSINGKWLRPVNGNIVTPGADISVGTLSGTTFTATDPDFTITKGTGDEAVTVPYYIYEASTEANPVTVTLSYSGDLVTLGGLPEGTTLNAVEGQAMQRSFTMPATDVALTATAVTGLTATAVTYDGSAQTPVIKQGDDDFADTNYTIAYKLGNAEVTAANVKDANTYTCTLTGLGQYVGTASVDFTINKADYHEPDQILDITKYVPSDKAGSFTIALPELPTGATYSCYIGQEDDVNTVISTYPTITSGKLTFTTTSGKTAGTTATITVEAKDAPNYNDYSFTVNAIVSEYTVAYAWPEQTSIWLDEDNELVWAESGVTLNTSLITINGGTPTNVTYKVGETTLTAGEKTVELDPGAHRISITSADGKLDDWVDFKVIKLIEDGQDLTLNVPDWCYPDVALKTEEALVPEWAAIVGSVTYAGTTIELSKEDISKGNGIDNESLKLWFTNTDKAHMSTSVFMTRELTIDDFYYDGGTRSYITPFGSVVEVGGYNVYLPNHVTVKPLLDDDGNAIPAGDNGGKIYYMCNSRPDLHVEKSESEVGGQTVTELTLYNGDTPVPEDYYFRHNDDFYYGNGENAYKSYGPEGDDGFISFWPVKSYAQGSVYPMGDKPVTLRHAFDGNQDPIFDENGNPKYVSNSLGCGNYTKLTESHYESSWDVNTGTLYVGKNYVYYGGNGGFLYTGDVAPSVQEHKLWIGKYHVPLGTGDKHVAVALMPNDEIDGSQASDVWILPHAYARYKADDYHYQIADCEFVIYPNNSLVKIKGKEDVYHAGDNAEIVVKLQQLERGMNIFVNGSLYQRFEGYGDHTLTIPNLREGKYTIDVFGDGDDYVTDFQTSTSFTVVRTDPVLTLTGTTPAGTAFTDGAEFQYDPENPVIITAANDAAVSGTSWKWTISDTDVVTQNKIVNNSGENAVNRESIYLNTVGLGEVTVMARFSGNELYNPARKSITFTVAPLMTTLFAANTTNQWMTWCNAYAWTLPEGCTAYTISSVSGTTVTLSEVTAEENAPVIIPAYTPVLIQRETIGDDAVMAEFSAVGTAPETGYNSETGLVTSTGTGFTFYGNSGNDAITTGYYTAGQTYGLYNNVFVRIDSDSDNGLAAHRCVLTVSGSNARQLSIGTEATGITTTDYTDFTDSDGAWYSLDGRKLNGKPTKKGLYIHNGVKTVIK